MGHTKNEKKKRIESQIWVMVHALLTPDVKHLNSLRVIWYKLRKFVFQIHLITVVITDTFKN